MTDREKAIVMAYTGTAMLVGEKFSIFHKYIEDILGRPVWTHELADHTVMEEIKEKSKSDFLELCKNEETSQWIPIKYRPLTIEERESLSRYFGIDYEEIKDDVAFDCPMPDEGQEILISTSYGVATDVCEHDCTDDGIYMYSLENCGDWDGVNAWMPLPKTYKSEVQDEDS